MVILDIQLEGNICVKCHMIRGYAINGISPKLDISYQRGKISAGCVDSVSYRLWHARAAVCGVDKRSPYQNTTAAAGVLTFLIFHINSGAGRAAHLISGCGGAGILLLFLS